MSVADDKARMFALMARYNKLGQLLDDDLDTDDAAAVAEAEIILAEMSKTMAEIGTIMDRHRVRPAN